MLTRVSLVSMLMPICVVTPGALVFRSIVRILSRLSHERSNQLGKYCPMLFIFLQT